MDAIALHQVRPAQAGGRSAPPPRATTPSCCSATARMCTSGLRRRPRRRGPPGRRWSPCCRACATAARPGSCSCRGRGSGFADPSRGQRRLRAAPGGGHAAVGVLLRRAGARREPASLDGKARLAERARRRTGADSRRGVPRPDAGQSWRGAATCRRCAWTPRWSRLPARPRRRTHARAQRRGPAAAAPDFAAAVQPSAPVNRPAPAERVALLLELIALCRDRPRPQHGPLLEHYAEREEGKALRRLAVLDLPGDEAVLARRFQDAPDPTRSPDRAATHRRGCCSARPSGLNNAESWSCASFWHSARASGRS